MWVFSVIDSLKEFYKCLNTLKIYWECVTDVMTRYLGEMDVWNNV